MNREHPFITVGIASYNYAGYLLRAFEAIKKQEFTDFEVLYSDDGSTDNSVDVIQRIIRDNPQMSIRLVQGANGGVMVNKNRILDNAKGEYVMLCDADDWMEPDCLEILCATAKKTNVDQVAGGFQNVDENGKILQKQIPPEDSSKWTWGVHHATIYKMKIIQQNNLRMQPDLYPDDVCFNMMFHKYSDKTVFVPQVLYNWYTHPKSASARSAKCDMWHGKNMLESAMRYFRPIYQAENDEIKQEIEYMALKLYGLSIYYRAPGKSFSAYWKEYRSCNKIIKDAFPNYKKNPYAKMFGGGVKTTLVRKRTAYIIAGTVFLENFHLMFPALFAYWCVSHFIAFGI